MQVDFYLVWAQRRATHITNRLPLGRQSDWCDLKLFIQTSTHIQARQFDDALWSALPERFTPHRIISGLTELSADEPIQIGTEPNQNRHTGMLISLCETVQSPLSK